MYEDKQRIARGAFAHVFTCQPPKICADNPDLAVKVTDLPTAGDNPVSQVCVHDLPSFILRTYRCHLCTSSRLSLLGVRMMQ